MSTHDNGTSRGWSQPGSGMVRWLVALTFTLVCSTVFAQWQSSAVVGQTKVALQGQPEALALAKDARVLAVALRRDKAIAVVNPDTGLVVKTIALPRVPIAVAMDSAGQRAFLLYRDSGIVALVDIGLSKVSAEWSLGGQLSALALRPDGQELAIADTAGSRVVAINPSTGAILRAATLPSPPTTLAYGKLGQRLLVGHGGSVTSLDGSSFAVLRSVALANEITGLGFWEGGLVALAVTRRVDGLDIVNTEGGSIESVLEIDGLPENLTVDQTAARGFVTSIADQALNRADLSTRQIEGRYALYGRPAGAVFDPITSRVLLALPDEDEIVRLDPQSATLANRLRVDGQPRDVVVNNATHEVLWIDDKRDEFTRWKLSDGVRQTIKLPGRPRRLVIDETKNLAIVAISSSKHQLAFVDLSKTAPVVLAERIDSPAEVRAIAVDGTRALTVVIAGSRVLGVDNTTRTLVRTLPGDQPYVDVAASPSRGLAYLLTEDGQLRTFNLATRALAGGLVLPFRANGLAVWEGQNRAVILEKRTNRARVFDLTTLKEIASHVMPRRPGAVAIQQGSGAAAVASVESGQLSTFTVDSADAPVALGALSKAGRLAVSSRYNRAYVLSGESASISVIALPNPVPVIASVVPSEAGIGSGPLEIRVLGKRFIDSSRVRLDGVDLVTTWVSPTEVTAVVPASLLTSGRSATIEVFTPEPVGGTSNAVTFTVRGLSPTLSGVSPARIEADGEVKQIVLTGQNFQPNAVAQFRGFPLITSFNSATQLTATIPASLTVDVGTFDVRVQSSGAPLTNAVGVTFVPPAPRITGFAPNSGIAGTVVTVSGKFFGSTTQANTVRFNGIDAIVTGATPTQVTALVPEKATTGPISVATANGTGASSGNFEVLLEQDYNVVVSPAVLALYQGGSGSATVQLGNAGRIPFQALAQLIADGLPAGVTVKFQPVNASVAQVGQIVFSATTGAVIGDYNVAIRAEATIAGRLISRKSQLTVSVKASSGMTGVSGRFIDPAGKGIAGILVRADTGGLQQPETRTDAAGNFLLVGLPAGKVTLRMDATPANPLYPIWPYLVDLPNGQITQLADWRIDPPPTEDKFTQIANASQAQKITDARYPGLEITLPAGARITGWDGVVKTRIAVEKHEITKLPVPPPPANVGAAYQMYFGTPMGGIPSVPIPVTLPNDLGMDPGEKADLWFFDGSPINGTGEWKTAGKGTVSADGSRIITDAGAGIPRFCGVCGLACFGNPNPPQNPTPKPPPKPQPKPDDESSGSPPTPPTCTSKPISLAGGEESPTETDLGCGGRVALRWSRTYNPVDAFGGIGGANGSLGWGWTSNYDALLLAQNDQVLIVMPGNDRVRFSAGAVGFSNGDDPRYAGASLTKVGQDWRLTTKTGETWRFAPFSLNTNRGIPFFLVEFTDSSGNSTTITRNSAARITSVASGERFLSVKYGSNGFANEVSDNLGRKVSYTYTSGSDARIETYTDAEGGVTAYEYQAFNNFKQVRSPPISAGGGGTFDPSLAGLCGFFVFPTSQNYVQIKSVRWPGNTAKAVHEFSESGRILKQTLPDGSVSTFSYKIVGGCAIAKAGGAAGSFQEFFRSSGDVDSFDSAARGVFVLGGRVAETTVTDARGNSYRRLQDTKGYAIEYADREGQIAKYELDSNGRWTKVTDALGRVFRYTYDEKGNVVRSIDPSGRVIDYTYDAAWNKRATVTRYLPDSSPVTWSYSYSPKNGKPAAITDPLGNVTTMTYSDKGDLLSVKSPLGQVTSLEYNTAGDLTKVVDPLGNGTVLSRDAVGRSTGLTNPLGHTTRYSFDGIDRITKITDAIGGETTLAYDARQVLSSVTNPRGVAIERYENDALLRRSGLADAAGKTEQYLRDGNGNVSQFTDRSGRATKYAYDREDRLTRIEFPDGVVQTRRYDAVGRFTEMREPDNVNSFVYDINDRVVRSTQETLAGRSVIDYEYDTLDRVVKRVLSFNGRAVDQTRYRYDKADRVVEIGYSSSELAVLTEQRVLYEWDASSRLMSKTLTNGIKQTITYDNADRVTRIDYVSPAGAVIEAISYSYDAGGQRVRRSVSGDSVQETPMQATYDSADRLVSLVLFPGQQKEQRFLLSYDALGNLISKEGSSGSTQYRWDTRNRLISIVGPDMTSSFTYDVLGRRTSRNVNGMVTSYLHDGQQYVGEVVAGTLKSTSLFGPDLDEVLTRFTSGRQFAQLSDALRSVLRQTGDNSQTTSATSFSPYGESRGSVSGEDTVIGFSGRELDPTGLLFLRARYYEPTLKRFISEDPIGLVGGLNYYGYVNGNPLSFTDPYGLQSVVTDMTNGTTTFDPAPYPGNSVTISTRNDVVRGAAPGARDPYTTPDTNWLPGGTRSGAYGPDGSYIDTGDPRGRDIHGGGSRLRDPFAPNQGWAPTQGCTRGQNEDVRRLGEALTDFKRRNPGVRVPYTRR